MKNLELLYAIHITKSSPSYQQKLHFFLPHSFFTDSSHIWCVFVCVRVCAFACLFMHVCVHVCAFVYLPVSAWTCMHPDLRTCVRESVGVYCNKELGIQQPNEDTSLYAWIIQVCVVIFSKRLAIILCNIGVLTFIRVHSTP